MTPREEQIKRELARIDQCIPHGHVWEHGRNDCVVCGENYPAIYMAEAHEFDLPGDVVLYNGGGAQHVEAFAGDRYIGHGSRVEIVRNGLP